MFSKVLNTPQKLYSVVEKKFVSNNFTTSCFQSGLKTPRDYYRDLIETFFFGTFEGNTYIVESEIGPSSEKTLVFSTVL